MTQLFLDCDGVLADFDRGMEKLLGRRPNEWKSLGAMWKAAAHHDNFYGSLPLMPDAEGGRALWNAVVHLDPIILTGIPYGGWAPKQKRGWAYKMFQTDRIITCFAKEKPQHGKPGDILVDDRKKAKDPWEAMGGQFVLHTSTKDTLNQLRALGLQV